MKNHLEYSFNIKHYHILLKYTITFLTWDITYILKLKDELYGSTFLLYKAKHLAVYMTSEEGFMVQVEESKFRFY